MQATKKQKLDVESIEHPHLNIPTENIIQSESTEKTDISILKETEQTKDIDILKETKETKQSKRRVALFLGYNGLGYTGMQINTPQKTIEQALHNALALSHAVSSQNANDPKKINFARCARTDKGVHALGQCVSLNMIVGDEGIVERINEHLPKQIRVWGYVPTTKSFHAKNACDSRMYEYLLPTHMLCDALPSLFPRSKLACDSGVESISVDYTNMAQDEIFAMFVPSDPLPTPDSVTIDGYRVPLSTLTHLRNMLAEYVGTHNFYNYTVKKEFKDPSAKRYILSFTASDPFVRDNKEYVSLMVKGQSFMLHQIRKMVGMAVMCVRTHTPPSIIRESFGSVRLNTPKVPALGLLLVETFFTFYNTKWASGKGRQPVSFSPYCEEMTAFKEEWIYSAMMREERESDEFNTWINAIDTHSREYEWFLTKDGLIDETQKPPHIHGKFDGKVKEDDEKEDE